MVTRETLDYFLSYKPHSPETRQWSMQIKKNKKRMSLTSPATDSPSSAAKTRSRRRAEETSRRLSHPGGGSGLLLGGAAASVRRLGRGRTSSIGGDDSRGGVRRLVVNGGSTRMGDLDQRWCTARDGQSGVDRSVREDEMWLAHPDGTVTHGSGPVK
ncbi:hypothetical protein M6B38_377835 [Iris pallida]|uniref:Uncharacterized protein n=1 Tax=Iris pallida TaxID=29817 RepID=A0AAX6GBT6_IRIPA|nr:hypothetical protein M6B38_377835 [Iris pallida]